MIRPESSSPRRFSGAEELAATVGTTLGASSWLEMTQERIHLFADATGDNQWIHVDPERAARGPFGATVAHGYLTLSLISAFLPEVYRVEGVPAVLNYGLETVRFPQPVPVGSRLRAVVTVERVEQARVGRRIVLDVVVEIEGQAKPACVAKVIHVLVKE